MTENQITDLEFWAKEYFQNLMRRDQIGGNNEKS